MHDVSARLLFVFIALIVIVFSGCATPAKDKAKLIVPDGYKIKQVKCADCPEGSAVFVPKEPEYRSKLEILRGQAALLNNRQTTEIAAGATAAVAAYAATDAYFRARNEKPNPYVSMAATAGSAYAAAALAGIVYDLFTSRKK